VAVGHALTTLTRRFINLAGPPSVTDGLTELPLLLILIVLSHSLMFDGVALARPES